MNKYFSFTPPPHTHTHTFYALFPPNRIFRHRLKNEFQVSNLADNSSNLFQILLQPGWKEV